MTGHDRPGLKFAALILAGLCLSFLHVEPAHARWLKAESERFIVYSAGNEDALRAYTEKLEGFDSLLRAKHGLTAEQTAGSKLNVYLVRKATELERVWPGAGDSVAGFYTAGADQVSAIAIVERDSDATVLHEYVHHFMLAHFPYPYPGWLVEGWAEYFMTTDFRRDSIEVGKPDGDRAGWLLYGEWLPLRVVLSARRGQLSNSEAVAAYYSQAWLVTHYFLADPARAEQLRAYMVKVAEGADPVKAMEAVTGAPIAKLESTVKAYARGKLVSIRYPRDAGWTPPKVTITTLSAAADDLLLEGVQLQHGVPEKNRSGLLRRIRERAAKHPGDPLAELTLARAEIRLGDRAAAEALLQARLKSNPQDVEALALLAESRLEAAEAEPARRAVLRAEAAALLTRAYKADPRRWQTLYAYARARSEEPTYPTPATLDALLEAHAIAPQVGEIRLTAAHALAQRGRGEEAVALLQPLLNHPHGGAQAQAARTLVGAIEANSAPATPEGAAER